MNLKKTALLIMGIFMISIFTSGLALGQADPRPQTDLTITIVILPDRTTPGGEFGNQARVMIYNQGTTTIEGGFSVEMVISSDRNAPIEPAKPTTTFVEDGLLPNGRVIMPTIAPEMTYTFSIPGMTMVTDAPVNDFLFVCAVVDPENSVNEEWRAHFHGYGVNKLCNHIFIAPGTGSPTPVTPPVSEPPTSELPANNAGSVADYDSDGDCVISESEFFVAVDQWIAEQIENSIYFAIVDAWIAQSSICGAASSARLSLRRVAQGLLISSSVQRALGQFSIYDAHGREISMSNSSRQQALWNLRDSRTGDLVANGVYFVRFATTGELKKIVLLR